MPSVSRWSKCASLTIMVAAIPLSCALADPPASNVPAVLDGGDGNPVELGTRFTSSFNGNVTSIKFYKSPQDTGAHTVELWDSTGKQLATAVSSNETASGWQTVNFATPVVITAGTSYIASYHSASGHWPVTRGYFATQHVSGVLTAPADSTSTPNGLYGYGSGSGTSAPFPTGTYQSSNYWVDVNFVQTGTVNLFPTGPTNWQLVWSDEFNGTALDTTKWMPSMEDGLKYFNDSDTNAYEPANVTEAGGNLVLTGALTPGDGKPYTSGAVSSLSSFKYGYFESSLKLPTAKGTWPSWWFGWPHSGGWNQEYDVFESRGGEDQPFLMQTAGGSCSGHFYTGINPEDGFHKYGLLWNATDVVFYVDGVETCRTANLDNTPSPMMYAMLVGGQAACRPGLTPCPDPAAFPAPWLVDYVRVWQLPGTNSAVTTP